MAFDGTKPAYQDEILSQPLRDNFNYLKTQIDVEHNENGTHKDTLKKSGDISTGDFGIKKNIPALRLIGTEVNAQDIRIIETSGIVKLQKNLGTEASPVWNDFFTVNPSTYLIGTAKITEANLDSSTQIPDGRLAQIVTAGKVAESALPSTLAKLNTQNTFNNPQIIQGNDAGIYFDNNIDSLYKAEFKKNSDTTASILIKNKSDGSDVAAYSFGADGNLTTKKLTAQTQLVSQVATGTAPLVVSSTTLVPNLYVARAAIANQLYPQEPQIFTSSGVWTKPATGTLAVIECWDGGNGGYYLQEFNWGGPYGSPSRWSGGAGGSYHMSIIPLGTLPNTLTVVVGAGGLWASVSSSSYATLPASNTGGKSYVGPFCGNGVGTVIEAGGSPNSYTSSDGSTTYANTVTNSGAGGAYNASPGITSRGGAGGASGIVGSAPGGGGGYGANGGNGMVRITIV